MIVIIDNDDSFTYTLYQNVGNRVDTRVFKNDKITVEEIEKLNPSGIILSGGKGHPKNSGICVELVRKLSYKIPILGICLGHQAIAYAFGSEIVGDPEMTHGKTSQIYHLKDPIFESIPTAFKAGRYHSLTVDLTTMPAELVITAICENNTIMGIKHDVYPCYGIEFHPESIVTPEGHQLLQNFIKLCEEKGEMNVDRNSQQAYAA